MARPTYRGSGIVSAGRRASATMAAQLRPSVSLRVIHLADQVQPDQLTTEAVRELLQAHRAVSCPIW